MKEPRVYELWDIDGCYSGEHSTREDASLALWAVHKVRATPASTLGIVGHEAAKFTEQGELEARRKIREAIVLLNPTKVVSGACHLGGIDIWAIEEAKAMGVETEEFAPKNLRWDPDGFKERNEKIAAVSDAVLCVVVDVLPASYKGRKFEVCYHCLKGKGCATPHIKSGGCWTTKLSKRPMWVVIPQVATPAS